LERDSNFATIVVIFKFINLFYVVPEGVEPSLSPHFCRTFEKCYLNQKYSMNPKNARKMLLPQAKHKNPIPEY
jgi:hypothetical protein